MTSPDGNFEDRLRTALGELGLDGDVGRVPQILAYLDELQRWNRVYNLTAVRDPSRMLVQHVFDSLAVVPVLRAYAQGRPVRVADIGSGGGLPGIILGICEPGWSIFCVDAVSKKTAFIRQAAGVLGLDRVQVRHARVESLESLQADFVISRAFASLADFVTVAAHHLAPSGKLLAMKGVFPQDEEQDLLLKSAWRVGRNISLRVPEMDAQRCLLELTLKDVHD